MGANTDISIPILSRMKRGNMKLDLSLDYHAHILPGCDHGSDGLATSLKQVEMAVSAGVKTICATPHFYPHKESVESFLRRREKTAGLLLHELPENAPLIQLGAEVLICDGMERLDGLNRLCREGTNELLLEMPFYAWPESIWDTLYFLCDLADIQIVLAHAERYPAENIEKLICESVPLQLNRWRCTCCRQLLLKGDRAGARRYLRMAKYPLQKRCVYCAFLCALPQPLLKRLVKR